MTPKGARAKGQKNKMNAAEAATDAAVPVLPICVAFRVCGGDVSFAFRSDGGIPLPSPLSFITFHGVAYSSGGNL